MLAAHARKFYRARLRGLAPPACTNLPSLQLISSVRKIDYGINTLTVSQHHLLHSLAALGFTDCRALFFAGAELPSRRASSHFSSPSAFRAPNNVRQALSQTPSSSHCFSRRQHAAGDWILVRVKTATPPRVCRTHRMHSKHARFNAPGTGTRRAITPRLCIQEACR
jgi:hypothetical protein